MNLLARLLTGMMALMVEGSLQCSLSDLLTSTEKAGKGEGGKTTIY